MIASFSTFPFLRRMVLCIVASFTATQITFAQPPKPPAGPPPLPPSPIEQFREWLAMKPEERAAAVADWPAEKQKVLLMKLRAYEALPAAEREHRLQMLELRWYLRPLMSTSPDDRKPGLALVPPALRKVVMQRLQAWDALDPESRKEILANDDARELVTNYFLQVQQGRPPEAIRKSLPPEKRVQLEEALKTWSELSLATRTRTAAQLTAFFRLSPEQQARTFDRFPEGERQEMQKTLETFAQLPPEQRRVCVESFEKFALMEPPERASFLRNAARWEAMTPQERATWKQLVTKLPPLPPIPAKEPPTPQASLPSHAVAQSPGQ